MSGGPVPGPLRRTSPDLATTGTFYGARPGKLGLFGLRPDQGSDLGFVLGCLMTHRVAINNSRIERLDREKGTVTFGYKDYSQGGRSRQMTLALAD